MYICMREYLGSPSLAVTGFGLESREYRGMQDGICGKGDEASEMPGFGGKSKQDCQYPFHGQDREYRYLRARSGR